MSTATRFERLSKGLLILSRHAPEGVEIEPVANSFPNGAPDHSTQAYLAIAIPFYFPLCDLEIVVLKSLGWKIEQEGDCAVFV